MLIKNVGNLSNWLLRNIDAFPFFPHKPLDVVHLQVKAHRGCLWCLFEVFNSTQCTDRCSTGRCQLALAEAMVVPALALFSDATVGRKKHEKVALVRHMRCVSFEARQACKRQACKSTERKHFAEMSVDFPCYVTGHMVNLIRTH